jgi:Domain of unknown function (DUF4124)
MTMNRALILAAGIAVAIAGTAAHAQTYQYKDSRGRTVISDTPPPASAQGSRTVGGTTADAAAAKAADAPKTTAEKEMDFRKRQQEAREKADKDAKEQAAAAQKRENCERARMQASALESGRRMLVPDGKGGETLMDDSARSAEIERAQRVISEACN